MNKLLKDWRFSFLIVPLASISLIYAGYKTLYPLLSYDVFPFQIPSPKVIRLITVLNSFLIPFVISRFYKLKVIKPTIIWTICTGIALILDRGVYEGNPNSGLALDIFPYQLLAILLTIIFVVIENRKSVTK